MKIKIARLKFVTPVDFSLATGHYLRGFFANTFSEVLFHNHLGGERYRYGYPLIQYKIIDGKPTVVGMNEGADLLCEHYLDVDELILSGQKFSEFEKILEVEEVTLGFASTLKYKYKFISPWMALNQKNYCLYIQNLSKTDFDENEFLQKILVGNILSFAKAVGLWIDTQVYVIPFLKSIPVKFKNQKMIGFIGEFYSNFLLPDLIGLGNSTSRGLGTIAKLDRES